MRILMVGSGGREHALIRKLKESPRCEEIYCAPGNGGISKDAVCVDISVEDIDGIAAFAKEKNIDLVFVAVVKGVIFAYYGGNSHIKSSDYNVVADVPRLIGGGFHSEISVGVIISH